jgi:hypothetical protein
MYIVIKYLIENSESVQSSAVFALAKYLDSLRDQDKYFPIIKVGNLI